MESVPPKKPALVQLQGLEKALAKETFVKSSSSVAVFNEESNDGIDSEGLFFLH